MSFFITLIYFSLIHNQHINCDSNVTDNYLIECSDPLKLKCQSFEPGFYQASPFKVKRDSIKITGDFIFGGLFPMHDSGDEVNFCGAIKEDKGIQRLEAMLYTIDMINQDNLLLPNLTIGESYYYHLI